VLVEEAGALGALAESIEKDMAKHSKSQFNKTDSKVDVKDMWAAVGKLTGRHQEPADNEGVTADHYAAISTDHCYTSQPQVLMAFQPAVPPSRCPSLFFAYLFNLLLA